METRSSFIIDSEIPASISIRSAAPTDCDALRAARATLRLQLHGRRHLHALMLVRRAAQARVRALADAAAALRAEQQVLAQQVRRNQVRVERLGRTQFALASAAPAADRRAQRRHNQELAVVNAQLRRAADAADALDVQLVILDSRNRALALDASKDLLGSPPLTSVDLGPDNAPGSADYIDVRRYLGLVRRLAGADLNSIEAGFSELGAACTALGERVAAFAAEGPSELPPAQACQQWAALHQRFVDFLRPLAWAPGGAPLTVG